jgi:CHAT domain-containing protein
MGAYAKAEPLYRQAIEIRKNALGEDHPDYATSLNNLAVLYAATNRPDEALGLMKEAFKIDDRMIGQVFSISAEEQRLAYISSIRTHLDLFLSLVFGHFAGSPDAVQDALNLILKRKSIAAEALAAQRDAILGGKYPHLREKIEELNTLRMQIARKTLAGPGQEGHTTHLQLLAEWNAEKERLEAGLARQIPEMRLEEQFLKADRAAVARTLPPGSALVEFFRYDVYDFTAIPAQRESPWKPARYCAFVLPSGQPENVTLIDLGEADPIDRSIALYRSKLAGEGRTGPAYQEHNRPSEKTSGLLSRLFGKKVLIGGQASSRDLGMVQEALEGLDTTEGIPLYSALMAPLTDAIKGCSRLFIAPDGQLNTLPFEVIPLLEGGYLIDHYPITYLGAGRDLLRFAAEIPGKPASALVMASPDFDLRAGRLQKKAPCSPATGRCSRDFERGSQYFSRLEGTKIEGTNIGRLLGTSPLLEQDALESRLKSVSSPLILHIATHGFFLTDQEREDGEPGRKTGMMGTPDMQRLSGAGMESPMLRSGLALAGANTWLKKGDLPPEAEDGILTAEDVTGLDLTTTDLVVLSACDTGMGEVKTGEGVFGLRRACVLAGAKTLVMSLWKVPDLPTQELMVDFYRRILKGTPKADALREAQMELRKKYPHPADWGAFICQGDPGALRQRV